MTRTPEEIDAILAQVAKTWRLVPNWRLGQLISNSQGPGFHDMFYASDFDVVAGLEDIEEARK